jgi:hypothetical protein
MGVKEKTIMVLTVPIFLRPLRKNKSAYPKVNAARNTICHQRDVGNTKSTRPVNTVAANKIEPPKSDFTIAREAGPIFVN